MSLRAPASVPRLLRTPWFALLGTLIAAYTALLLWYALVRKEEE